MYTIVQAPSEILRTPTKPVDFSGTKLQKIVAEMIETMIAQTDPEGVGLAANQVNLPFSIFIARFDTKEVSRSEPGKRSANKNINGWPIRVFINPEILEHSEDLQPEKSDKKAPLEGCLSRPNYYGSVKRWKTVRIKYYVLSIKGELESHEDTFEGFPAVVIQHEMDHLSGKIFIERILEQKGNLYKITGKDKNGKEKWEEVEI